MSTEALEHFRNLITQSFTIVAVDIFNQVQTLVKTYEDENKRLKALLNSVLQPEVRLPRIEDGGSRLPSSSVSPPAQFKEELSTSPEKVKEEEMEYDISEDFTIVIKTEPDQTLVSDTQSAAEMNCSTSSSVTVSAPASAHGDSEESDEDESEEEEMDQWNTEDGEASDTTNPPLQKTLLETPRFKKPDSSFLPTPDEYREFISRLSEAYQDMPEEQRPLITRLGLDKNIEFVDCALGKVPKGCPLSYQYPLPSKEDFTPLSDAPPQPRLPLQSQRIDPFLEMPPLTVNDQAKLDNVKVTWESAYNIEQATRLHKEIPDALKDARLMNCFRDIFHLRPGKSNAELLITKIKRGKRRSKHATIEQELKLEALREYCRLICINWYPCGLVVHPGAPWLAAFPDGLVYDPNESISFGLLHLNLENCKSFTECKYMLCSSDTLELKSKHPLYWHVQGEMMVTGTSWCDLLVFCGDDMLVQRIYRDEEVIKSMKMKVDEFFFYHFLPSYTPALPFKRVAQVSE